LETKADDIIVNNNFYRIDDRHCNIPVGISQEDKAMTTNLYQFKNTVHGGQ